MTPGYESWTKASLIREIHTLREGLHQLGREAMRKEIENQRLKIRLGAIERVREFFHGRAA